MPKRKNRFRSLRLTYRHGYRWFRHPHGFCLYRDGGATVGNFPDRYILINELMRIASTIVRPSETLVGEFIYNGRHVHILKCQQDNYCCVCTGFPHSHSFWWTDKSKAIAKIKEELDQFPPLTRKIQK